MRPGEESIGKAEVVSSPRRRCCAKYSDACTERRDPTHSVPKPLGTFVTFCVLREAIDKLIMKTHYKP